MFSNTVGAENIETKFFSCVIRKIECSYEFDGEEKKVVFFERSAIEKNLQQKNVNYNNGGGGEAKGRLFGCISNTPDFYFITNHKGKDVEVKCTRKVNSCTDEKHNKYEIDYIDIDSRELKTDTKEINDGKLKLYYYNIFYRTGEYAKAGASKGADVGKSIGTNIAKNAVNGPGNVIAEPVGSHVGEGVGTLVGGFGGMAGGHLADLFCSLRFFILPIIKKSDDNYSWHTTLAYRECPNRNSVPTITIYTYPDIEFTLKIGFKGHKHEYNKNNEKKDKITDTPWSVEFTSKYAGTEKQLTFKKINESELDEEAQKGTRFYNAIHSLAEFFEDAAQFSQKIQDLIGDDQNQISKDVGSIGNLFDKTGTAFANPSPWLKGSLEIAPSLTLKWRYSVSEDLTKIGRHIEAELGVKCKGELTINLIEVAIMFSKKAKKASTVAVAATSVASGGLAALPALLIKFLVDAVVDWLIKKFKEGVKFDLILATGATLKAPSVIVDTSSEKTVEIKGVIAEINLEIKLVAALEYKASGTLLFTVKAEGAIKASAEAAASLTWTMELNMPNGYLGIDNNVSINPFSMKLEYKVSGSFELFGYSMGSSDKTKVKEWKAKEYKLDPWRWEWFKLYDDAGGGGGGKSWPSSGGTMGGGRLGGGGGGSSW